MRPRITMFLAAGLLTALVLLAPHWRATPPVAMPDEGECTTAVIAGRATASGRPLLWKNRDVSQPHQEIVFFDDGIYPYVTIANARDSTQAWGGVNSAGFAIEDADNWNTPDTVSGSDDDGVIMKRALQRCRVVADFQALLDSCIVPGIRNPAIYGVIDSAGGASIFECFAHRYVRYDASDTAVAPLGILVRSNFSYAGGNQNRIGVYRHDRAKALIEAASRDSLLDAYFMAQTVVRDLMTTDTLNPYPLPYEGRMGDLPVGWISTYGAICRRLTVSACIIEGVRPGENPLLSTMWAFPMAAQYGVVLPFWVASASTPPEVNGDSTAPLCDEGLRIKAIAQHQSGFRDTLDTYVLNDGQGGGIHSVTLPLEDYIFARTQMAMTSWRQMNAPDSAAMRGLTAELAALAYREISRWPDLSVKPGADPTPRQFAFRDLWPNPFNARAQISFVLLNEMNLDFTVFDVLGREAVHIGSRVYPAGSHEIAWDASALPSGLYLIRAAASGVPQDLIKAVLLK